MKSVEKIKFLKIIKKLESGNFDENDIDNLFMKLRPYCKNHKKFLELSHFVAHNDIRDRGLINTTLEHMYFSFQFATMYSLKDGVGLNIMEPFPLWILKLIKYEAYEIDSNKFLEKYKFSRTSFLEKVKKSFKLDSKQGLAIYSKKSISPEFFSALEDCLRTVRSKIIFNQNEVIDEIISVLNSNNISFNEKNIRNNSDKIMICILLLLHNAEYEIESKYLGKTYIDYHPRKKGPTALPSEDNYINLSITGSYKIEIEDRVLDITSPMVLTNLSVTEWCDPNLFYSYKLDDGTNTISLDFQNEIGLTEEGKLKNIN
ncbi:hypothetical protein NRA40_10490 [Acinetobacter baumannii]|nr:hypothetical protein [Acinetobacter baumannii]